MPPVERGQRKSVRLQAMGRLGEAMAEIEGKPVFVFGGIPGEEVEIEVIREQRRYIAAEVVQVLSPSPDRVAPPCPYFGPCTGCQWQHISYRRQLELKAELVRDALRRVAGLEAVNVLPTLPSPQELGYRNHARFTVGRREGVLGYVHRERRRFVEIDACMLMDPWINEAMAALRGRCSETSQLAVRYGVNTGEYLIQPALHDPGLPLATGQRHYREEVRSVTFKVASPSFFQVNTRQAERMGEYLRQALTLCGNEVLVDAYAGVGVFAVLFAPHVARVIAIEESSSAVADAAENLASFPNVDIIKGKTEEMLGQLDETPDVVILDPPRAGCQREALESLMRLAPGQVVYVSCDPETLARDLKVLANGPYRIESVQPVDMFPQTYHVESIALLRLKAEGSRPVGGSHPIILASSSPRRKEILQDAGIPFTVTSPQGDEPPPQGAPEDYVQRLALAKALQVAAQVNGGLVLAADTVVVSEGQMLGKPRDNAHALEMLRSLRGRPHQVMTGVAVVDPATGQSAAGVKITTVHMRDYTDAEAQAFIAAGKARDKAGAYAVQDPDLHPAQVIEGCYLNVVGLPLCLAADLLRRMGAGLPDVSCCDDVGGRS